MALGLTFDEFADVRQKDQAFPLSTVAACQHLRQRGYDCHPPMLELLVEIGVVQLFQPDTWTREDVDAAAEYFEECEFFVPNAAMCAALGCRYVDFLRPLREAAERESARYGRVIPNSDQYFVMHRIPPRCITNENGDSVVSTPAFISFTLCDDVCERLERGEEV
ncbi:MAG: hypothetical protein KF777_23300 [Planctomycetaceae bacterium]|nr:hypothetical protein [Planctomycetaceae bacterium]